MGKEGTNAWVGTELFVVFPGAIACHVSAFMASKRSDSEGKEKYLSLTDRSAYRRLEDVVGCKWSAAVLAAIGRGVQRPGPLERFIPGISTKVLNERLRKLLDYRLITRTEILEKVPRTEYALTATGEQLSVIIEKIRDLDEEHGSAPES